MMFYAVLALPNIFIMSNPDIKCVSKMAYFVT